ncbi:MAG TPA: hypothetical protein VK963_02945 [Candidatus Saccharimonadales bacterium]|nr:hypothetical protein [Candidatus Saccharimonadales bacterium]
MLLWHAAERKDVDMKVLDVMVIAIIAVLLCVSLGSLIFIASRWLLVQLGLWWDCIDGDRVSRFCLVSAGVCGLLPGLLLAWQVPALRLPLIPVAFWVGGWKQAYQLRRKLNRWLQLRDRFYCCRAWLADWLAEHRKCSRCQGEGLVLIDEGPWVCNCEKGQRLQTKLTTG